MILLRLGNVFDLDTRRPLDAVESVLAKVPAGVRVVIDVDPAAML